MNWVGVAVFGPIILLCLLDPEILLGLIVFVALAYVPAWWVMEKVIGPKPITKDERDKEDVK